MPHPPQCPGLFHDNDLGNLGQSPKYSALDLEHYSNFCGACVEAAENENISAAQKKTSQMALEIGHWHVSLKK
jgi:hypothetical protein